MSNKKILVVLLTSVISFFVLFILFLEQLIPKLIFTLLVKENPILVLPGKSGGMYVYGIGLLSILIGWKIAQKFNPKVKNYIIAYRTRITQKFLLIISLIAVVLSFNQFYFFTNTRIYKIDLIAQQEVKSIEYSAIESVLIDADFRQGMGRRTGCQLYTDITLLSKYLTIEQLFLTYEQTFDIGGILREKRIMSQVTYSTSCNTVPEYRRQVIENSFDVKLDLN